MTKRRKKSNSYQKQKIVQAHYRNEFMHKFEFVLNSIIGEEVFHIIPRNIIDKVSSGRVRSFKIISAPDCSVPSSLLNTVKQLILNETRRRKITVIPGQLELLTIEEFYLIFLSVTIVLPLFISDDISSLKSIKAKLNDYSNLENIFQNARDELQSIFYAIALCFNDIGKDLYWLKHELNPTPGMENGLENLIIISSFKIKSQSIMIDGNPRPVLRMGYVFPNYGIDWISIKPSDLKINCSLPDTLHDVYVQSHALHRLSERIDCLPAGTIHYNMFISLKFPKVFYDLNHNILIEFRYYETRAGYFRLDITEGKIIIRTFLFITNNGTPEGQKLGKITGLQKLDKKYLFLDKLSTFMTSDIGNNEQVRKIFTAAGCQCLLELYERFRSIATSSSKQFNPESMLRYINYETRPLPESGNVHNS